MRIAVNARFLLKHKMEGFGWYSYETLKRITTLHPEHDFIFFFDRPYDPSFIFSSNVEPVVLRPPARHPVLFRIWFNRSVTRALKKHQADLFFSPDGYLSLRTKIPQIGVIHDLNFEHFPEDLPTSARNYLKKYFPLFARKAERVLTVSEYSKKDIVNCYGIPAEKIDVVYNGAAEVFKPVEASEQALICQKYTHGKPFIVFVGALHPRKNLTRLLQAFDQFKTDTSSETKLLIVGENLWKSKKLSIPNLHFQEDVVFTGHQPIGELAKIVGSAKFMAFVSYFEGFGIPLVEAMRSGCPILTANATSLPEIAGEAAHNCDPFDIQSIAHGLRELDTQETLRQSLIKKGFERSSLFTWDKTAEGVWRTLEKVSSDLGLT